jgi:hypothetical protein
MSIPKRSDKKQVIVTLFDLQWEANYNRLLKFKKKHKHTNVPHHYKEDPTLGNWVIRQRARKEFLSAWRIDKLDSAGFVWNTFEQSWETMYKQLEKFHKKYGHSQVSKYDKKYHKLGDWVGKQRKDRKNKETRLTAFKIKKLSRLNFNWGISYTDWEFRFEQLKAFKKRFGHTV